MDRKVKIIVIDCTGDVPVVVRCLEDLVAPGAALDALVVAGKKTKARRAARAAAAATLEAAKIAA